MTSVASAALSRAWLLTRRLVRASGPQWLSGVAQGIAGSVVRLAMWELLRWC